MLFVLKLYDTKLTQFSHIHDILHSDKFTSNNWFGNLLDILQLLLLSANYENWTQNSKKHLKYVCMYYTTIS